MKRLLVIISVCALFISSITVYARVGSSTFEDVPAGHKYYGAVDALYNYGIISGYPDGLFRPDKEINRAELLKMLVETSGKLDNVSDKSRYANCFSDVGSEWFALYVCYANEVGWVNGYPDSSFKPAQTVNKVESIKMILNSLYFDQEPISVDTDPFLDVDKDVWFAPHVAVAKEIYMLEETGNYLFPSANMTRAAVSEQISRLIQYDDDLSIQFNLGDTMTKTANDFTLHINVIETEWSDDTNISNTTIDVVGNNATYFYEFSGQESDVLDDEDVFSDAQIGELISMITQQGLNINEEYHGSEERPEDYQSYSEDWLKVNFDVTIEGVSHSILIDGLVGSSQGAGVVYTDLSEDAHDTYSIIKDIIRAVSKMGDF